LEPGIVGT
jgi:hypothetical protein